MYDDSGEYALVMANMRGRWLICCWPQNQSRLKFPDFGGDWRSTISRHDQQARSADTISGQRTGQRLGPRLRPDLDSV